MVTSYRIPDNWCSITPVAYKQDVALPAVPQFEKLGEVFSGGMLSDYLKKVTNLEVLEYGQLDVELPSWPLAQLRVVEKAPGKGRSEQGDEDDDEDDDEDNDGDGQLPFNIGRFKFLDEHRKRDLPCGMRGFVVYAGRPWGCDMAAGACHVQFCCQHKWPIALQIRWLVL